MPAEKYDELCRRIVALMLLAKAHAEAGHHDRAEALSARVGGLLTEAEAGL